MTTEKRFWLKPFVVIFILSAMAVFLLGGCGFWGKKQDNRLGLAASKTARQYLGVPYVYGGRTPKGFDCSGLTMYVYKRHGVALPNTSSKQSSFGQSVKKKYLQPGDLVFFRSSRFSGVNHVGIYIGGDKFIHAPGKGRRVTVANLSEKYFVKNYHSARRVP